MAATYDLSTDRGKVRLKIGDTDTTTYVFEDEEIDYFLTAGGSVNGGAIEALRALLASKSYRVKYANVQGVQYNDNQQIEAIRKALALLGGDVPSISVSNTGSMAWEAEHFRDGGQ